MNNQGQNIRSGMNQIQQPQPTGMVGNVQIPPGNVNMFNNNMLRPMGQQNVARRMPGPGGMNPQAQQQQQPQLQGQQQQNMGQQMNPQQMQQNQQQQNSSVLISQLNIMPQNQQGNVRMQYINQQQQNPNQAQQQQQMVNKPGMTGNVGGPEQQPQGQQQQPQQQQTPVTREKIWTGMIEYMDRQTRVPRQISVYATCAVKDGEPEV